MTPKISYVIASRNDGFCGDPMERLERTIPHCWKHTAVTEVIIVDWGSEIPIQQRLGDNWSHVPLTHLYIPPEITSRYPTHFCEVVALNAGIRRAKGDWIARLDQDILVGDRFVKWFNETGGIEYWRDPDPKFRERKPAYFSLRRDLPPGVHQPDDNAPIWNNERADTEGFYIGAVGILLAPRSLWHKVRGYDERLIHRNGMEIDLCKRFEKEAGLVNLGALLDCPFYHQHHERAEADARPSNPHAAIMAICSGGIENENGPTWGLGDVALDEVTI